MKTREESNTIKNNKMEEITTYLSIETLNVNGFNSSIKRHRLVDWIKNKTQRCWPTENPSTLAKTNTGLT
jgi:hypothetical protein